MCATVAMRPREPSLEVQQVCSQIFNHSPLKADRTKFTYWTMNDYGKKIDKLLFCKPQEGFSSHYFENMSEIAAIEGFEIVPSATVHACRDPKMRVSDGVIIEPTWHDNVYVAIGRFEKRAKYLKNHAAYLTKHPSFSDIHVGAVALQRLHRCSPEGVANENRRESRLYFEGGDGFHLTNAHGSQQYIFGDDLSCINHQLLRKNKWFSDVNPESDNIKTEAFVFAKYNDGITLPYVSKLIAKKIENETKAIREKLSDENALNTLKEMDQMGLLTSLKFNEEKDKIKGRHLAAEYLAELQFVKERLFPCELRCESINVIFSPQLAYHLDLAMMPGPKGSIFLADHEESVRLLESIHAKAKELGFDKKTIDHLSSFIQTTKQVARDLKPLFNETKKRYESAGHPVISTPAAFYSYVDGKPFNVNFLNCVTGYSEKTGHFYVIAPGTQTEGILGDVLMDCYVEFIKSHCNDVAVYFAGRNPKHERDFTEAVTIMNEETQQIGPHCLSFELKVSPHTTQIT